MVGASGDALHRPRLRSTRLVPFEIQDLEAPVSPCQDLSVELRDGPQWPQVRVTHTVGLCAGDEPQLSSVNPEVEGDADWFGGPALLLQHVCGCFPANRLKHCFVA